MFGFLLSTFEFAVKIDFAVILNPQNCNALRAAKFLLNGRTRA
jgi:hypothetical protein